MKSIKHESTSKISYFNENGRYHRTDGPALIYLLGYTGREEWFLDGKHHRDNKPSVYYTSGHYLNKIEAWHNYGFYHRIGGPSFIDVGRSWWHRSDKLHRLNAPAKVEVNRIEYWEFGIHIK
jgi:hypothetical protein